MYKTVMKDEKIQEISNFTATHGVVSECLIIILMLKYNCCIKKTILYNKPH